MEKLSGACLYVSSDRACRFAEGIGADDFSVRDPASSARCRPGSDSLHAGTWRASGAELLKRCYLG